MRKILPVLLAISLLSGCATHRLVVLHPNPYGETNSVSSTAYGWGTAQKRTVAEKCDNSLIDEVHVRQTFGQALVTVLTLGIVMQTKIEYVCAKTPAVPGSTDN